MVNKITNIPHINVQEAILQVVHPTDLGDDHISTSIATPLREDAFDLEDETKISLITNHFKEIMLILDPFNLVRSNRDGPLSLGNLEGDF